MLRTEPPTLADIQAPVSDRLDRVVEEFRRIVVADFDEIAEINEYLSQVRGKLFRPSLLLLCNEIGGNPSEEAETLGALVELVHMATLVHDDAVDHSVMRRGMPTVNAMWSHQIAIIMGDYFYSRAVSELAALGDLEPIRVLARASNAMSVGEMRQLASHEALGFTEDDYLQLIDCKTASLMSASCELGALAGEPRFQEQLARFGRELGMAFQIADDLLDYTADEAVTGKPSGNDLKEHKVTLPLIAALPHFSAEQNAMIEEFFEDKEPTDAAIEEIIEVVESLGGLEYAKEQALKYAERAREALDGLPDGPALDALQSSLVYAIERRR